MRSVGNRGMGSRVSLLVAGALAIVSGAATVRAAGPSPNDGDWSLVLFDAAKAGEKGDGGLSNVKLDITCIDGQWQKQPWMWNLEGGSVESRGVLKSASAGEGQITLELAWGDSVYTVRLRRTGNAVEGVYTGTLAAGVEPGKLAGRIEGEVYTFDDRSFAEVAPGEHPRLLLRKHDLPRVKAFAKTPLGKGLVDRLAAETKSTDSRDNPLLACALLYKIADDLERGETAADGVRSGRFSAGVFDLVYDLLSPEERARAAAALAKRTGIDTGKNATPWSNWTNMKTPVSLINALAVWKEPGLSDSDTIIETPLRWVQLAWNPGFGDGGWNTEGEGYTLCRTAGLLQAAAAYYNATGRHIATNRSDAMFLPHYVYMTVLEERWTERGERLFHKPVTGVGLTYGQGHDDDERVDAGQVCLGFPLVPASYKPAVLWYWQKWATSSKGQLDARKLGNAAYALVNYPHEMETKNPAEVMPFVLADRQKGGYVFRKSWRGGDDLLALVYYKTRPPSGAWTCAEGGTFRIYGFGKHWAVKCALGNPVITYPYAGKVEEGGKGDDAAKGYGNKSGEWRCENVVWVEGTGPVGAAIGGYQSNCSAHGGGGLVTHFEQGDAVASVSGDMSPLYLRNKMIERGTRHGDIGVPNLFPQNTRDRLGYVLRDNVEDLGIRATRAFAADMSGACGAPGLFVVVDRFVEQKDKHAKSWRMHLPEGRPKDAAPPDWFRPENCWYHKDPKTIPPTSEWVGRAKVAVDGNRFMVTQDGTDARLAGFVVPAAGTKLYHEEKFERLVNIDRKNFVGYSPIIRNAVTIEAHSEFFVVMTLGPGEPPKVTAEGEGLNAKVTVGGLTVRFDGKAVVFGK